MKYKIDLFCPDRHIPYDLNTLEHKGVGGGITARIRLAHALARLDQDVTVHVNCPRNESIAGVHYRHFSQMDKVVTDIFIASTSGDGLELGSLAGKNITASLKILMVHGVRFPQNIDRSFITNVYAPSNFIRKIAITRWQMDPSRMFVTHHGVDGNNFTSGKPGVRDPFSMTYCSHPSKGFEAAMALLRILRQFDARYSLHVFGGNQLWGEPEMDIPGEPGLTYHGLVGQRELGLRLREIGFSLNLQAREEPYGMVIDESMRAGCIVLASPVGAYSELVRDGYNGFLIPGEPKDPNTCAAATGTILELMKSPGYMNTIRENAIHSPLSWETIARAWLSHWDSILQKDATPQKSTSGFAHVCPECSGSWLALVDGLHCQSCGNYQVAFPNSAGTAQFASLKAHV